MVTEEILSPTFVTEWRSMGCSKSSDFVFWLIFLVSSPPLLTTMTFPHSQSIKTSLVKSSKFPISSILISSISSSAVAFFSEELPFPMKP